VTWSRDRAKRSLKRLGVGLIIFLALSQFIRPARTNPPTDPRKTLEAAAHPPATVAVILDRACGDCHTNRTRWPWYTNVAPISWWIIDHVNEGRRRVSYDDWGDYDPARQRKELDQTCQRVDRQNMPLTSYLLVHGEAALSDRDRQAICDWTRAMMLTAAAPPDRR
jgi:hypothetical protein